jgi:hypothetical protein
MYSVDWFLEDKHIGSGTMPSPFKWGAPIPQHSNAYYCPVCGDVWARIAVQDAKWFFIPRRCKKHGPPFLLQYNTHELNSSAPIEIWAREFLIAMELMKKQNRPYDVYLVASGVG